MKRLSDVVIATRSVPVGPDQSFDVRGINVMDITALFFEHGPEMTASFNKLMAMKSEGDGMKFTFDVVKQFLTDLIKECPNLIAAAIAEANDDPAGWTVVRRLPAQAQLDAIMAVTALSIESDAQLKKLVETASSILEGIGNGMISLNAILPSPNGSSDSAKG